MGAPSEEGWERDLRLAQEAEAAGAAAPKARTPKKPHRRLSREPSVQGDADAAMGEGRRPSLSQVGRTDSTQGGEGSYAYPGASSPTSPPSPYPTYGATSGLGGGGGDMRGSITDAAQNFLAESDKMLAAVGQQGQVPKH